MTAPRGPRVAIACSGLGHVRRGNETWARGVAEELHRAGTDVTLLGGGPQGDASCRYVRLRSLPRDAWPWRRLLSWHRRYLLEQVAFEASLRHYLRRHPHDVVHVADPILALRLQRAASALRTRVIYKDGLLLGPSWISNFRYAQVLAPWYLESAAAEGHDTTGWFVIPHLVDVRRFHPPADRAAARAALLGDRIPAGDFVVLGVGDFSPGSNKRLDWLVEEVARLPAAARAHLVLLGQATPGDVARFERLGAASLPGRLHLFPNVEPGRISEWYRAADVFAHAALREPFGIVFLEAMASGLPLLGHRFPVTEWIIGEGGRAVDMSAPGELSGALASLAADPARRAALGAAARRRAESTFAAAEIVPLYQRMYERIVAEPA